MNPKTLISTLLGLSVLASAQIAPKVPVLSEPRSIPLNTISYDAWGDTLIASRMRTSYRIVRKGDQVVLIDSLVSDSLLSEMPRTFPLGDGTHIQTSYHWLANLDWTRHTAGVALPGLGLGYSRVEGDLFRKSGNDTIYGILCSPMSSIFVKRPQGGAWTLGASLSMNNSGLTQHCAVDPISGQAVRFFHTSQGDSSKLQSGDATRLLISAGIQSVPIKPTTVFAEPNGWLAYNDSTGKILVRYDDGTDRPSLDRMIQPTELAGLNDKYVQPVRKDSLMVFGGDSTLVLAGWRRGQFQVYQTIQLDSRINHAMALGDSVLWIQCYSKVLSLRIRWENRATRASHNLGRVGSLRIQHEPGTLSFHWSGAQETPLVVRKADGTLLLSSRIPQNGHINMTTKNLSGALFVSTANSTDFVMVIN